MSTDPANGVQDPRLDVAPVKAPVATPQGWDGDAGDTAVGLVEVTVCRA